MHCLHREVQTSSKIQFKLPEMSKTDEKGKNVNTV
jgi:hypothetical protein